MTGVFILSIVILGAVAFVAAAIVAKRSRRPPGGVEPRGPDSPRVP